MKLSLRREGVVNDMLYDYELFKQGNHYIRLESQEKYNQVMRELEELGFRWSTGERPTENDVWYNCYTCIFITTEGVEEECEFFGDIRGLKRLSTLEEIELREKKDKKVVGPIKMPTLEEVNKRNKKYMYDYELFKQGNHYIRLETQGKYDQVMEELDKLGFNWVTGEKVCEAPNCWVEYRNLTMIAYDKYYGGFFYRNIENHQDTNSKELLLGEVNKVNKKYTYDYELFKKGNHYIKLETADKFDKVMEELESLGFKWRSGINPTEERNENNLPYLVFLDKDGIFLSLDEELYEWSEYKELLPLEKGENKMDRKDMNMKELYREIDKIYFNEKKRTTVIKFKDGSTTKSTASLNTDFCEYAGFTAALMKYKYGKLKNIENLIKRKGIRQRQLAGNNSETGNNPEEGGK